MKAGYLILTLAFSIDNQRNMASKPQPASGSVAEMTILSRKQKATRRKKYTKIPGHWALLMVCFNCLPARIQVTWPSRGDGFYWGAEQAYKKRSQTYENEKEI